MTDALAVVSLHQPQVEVTRFIAGEFATDSYPSGALTDLECRPDRSISPGICHIRTSCRRTIDFIASLFFNRILLFEPEM
jgi:hypothetical protein